MRNNAGGTGTLGIVKSGPGTQVLGASNSYTAGTSVNQGILSITTRKRARQRGAVNFNGGTLNLSNSVVTIANQL